MQQHQIVIEIDDKDLFCKTCAIETQDQYDANNCDQVPYEDFEHFKARRRNEDKYHKSDCEMCQYIRPLEHIDILTLTNNHLL